MNDRELCSCEQDYYDPERYSSCYNCFLERRADYLSCIFCGKWHSPKFATCFSCRTITERADAGSWLRQHILIRDNFTCQECGATENLQVDHVIPCAKGGNARPWNLLTRCAPCNRRKGDTWYAGCRYEADRRRLLEAYFFHLRHYLTPDEHAAFGEEVQQWRREHAAPAPPPPQLRLILSGDA